MNNTTNPPQYGPPDWVSITVDFIQSSNWMAVESISKNIGTAGGTVSGGILSSVDIVAAARNGTAQDVAVQVGGFGGSLIGAEAGAAAIGWVGGAAFGPPGAAIGALFGAVGGAWLGEKKVEEVIRNLDAIDDQVGTILADSGLIDLLFAGDPEPDLKRLVHEFTKKAMNQYQYPDMVDAARALNDWNNSHPNIPRTPTSDLPFVTDEDIFNLENALGGRFTAGPGGAPVGHYQTINTPAGVKTVRAGASYLDAMRHAGGANNGDGRPSGSSPNSKSPGETKKAGDANQKSLGGTSFSGSYHTDKTYKDIADGKMKVGLPILLDLDGDGVRITELSRATRFFDGSGDGLRERTAWAAAGNGVLFYDPDGRNAITEKRQYVFTEWNPTAQGDMEALRSVFDTNGDGKLTSADADFTKFKVLVTNADGSSTVRTLAFLGITGINLTADATTVVLPDGSAGGRRSNARTGRCRGRSTFRRWQRRAVKRAMGLDGDGGSGGWVETGANCAGALWMPGRNPSLGKQATNSVSECHPNKRNTQQQMGSCIQGA